MDESRRRFMQGAAAPARPLTLNINGRPYTLHLELANAVCHATGQRVRDLPIRLDDLI
jgi:hypothetical protein